MERFQPRNVDAIQSERIVCIAKTRERRAKAFQVVFNGDGSLFVVFPYFRHRVGILSASAIPATGELQSEVDLEKGGKVTSHLVKYSHHPDGRAHFSQSGKIVTAIKRQSIALDKQRGHLFSLLIQGHQALDAAHPAKDIGLSEKRAVVDFDLLTDTPEAIKFVGRWFDVNDLRVSRPNASVGPIVPTRDPEGIQRDACLFTSPSASARHVLAVTCETIPRISPAPELFMFYGGFDSPELALDPTREAGFLAFVYPLSEADRVRERLGSVDYFPKS